MVIAMPKKGMVITVGVGRGIESAITLSIKNANPDFVVFLVTDKSRQTLEQVRQYAQENSIPLPTYEEQLVEDENDVQKAYEAAVKAIQRLRQEGIEPANITVDYTTGSKPMSAGALYAAIMEGCASVVYVTGQRDEETGRVISGTEQFLSASPNRLFARRVRAEAVRLFNACQFAAAEKVIDNFLRPFPPDRVSQLFPDLDELRRLCRAYSAWDAFDHVEAKEAFDAIDKTVMERWSQKIAENKGWVNQITRALQSDDLSQRLCPQLLVDLWANALRRLQESRFIDAVARLYRLTELIAQFRLWRCYKIDTSDVDVSKVPEEMRVELEAKRDEKGKFKVAMDAAYRLLKALGDELGHEYEKPALRDALRHRNESIAAHGLNPVTDQTAKRLKEAIEPLLRKVVPELDRLLARATFLQFPT